MTESPFRVIRLIALANGEPSPLDGQWVTEYDPSRDGTGPNGEPMNCHLLTTPDPTLAKQYSTTEALEVWRKVDSRQPRRPDGQPNRPLTAYTVEIGPPPGGATPPPATISMPINS